jgi:hypothetical protein
VWQTLLDAEATLEHGPQAVPARIPPKVGFASDIPNCRTGLREDEIGAREEDRPWAQGGVKEKGWQEIGPIASTFQRGGQEGQTFIHPVVDTAVIVGKLLVAVRDTKFVQTPHKPAGAVE